MNVFDLFAKISLDTSEYDAGLDESAEKASSFGKNLVGGLKTAGKIGATAIAAVGTAAVGATSAMIKGASEVAAYGDNIDKMSQKMGLSAEAYQEWDHIMRHNGTTIESMQAGMKTLANAVESGNEAFMRLGMTEEQIAGMSQEELFEATITGLQNVEDTTERTYLAGQLLGRGATELGALLNMSADETEEMRQQLHELGGVMSDEAVKSAAAYQDAMQDMTTAFEGTKRTLQAEFLPGMTDVMRGLADIFSGNMDAGLEKISGGVNKLITNTSKMLPKAVKAVTTIIQGLLRAIIANLPQFMRAGLDLLQGLVTGITENFPLLAQAAMDIIIMLAQYLVDNLPELLRTGLELIVFLANAISENLPALIPAIVEIILQIVETLTEPDTLLMLVDAAIALILALADGLIDALPKLLEKAPVIIAHLAEAIIKALPKIAEAGVKLLDKLWEAIKEGFWKLVEVGGDLVIKLIEGIASLWEDIKNTGKKIGTKVKDGVMEFVEAAKQWGKDLIQNFIDGILAKWDNLKKSVSDVAGSVKDFLGFSEPKEGPLSNFHTYAPDMMELFAQGIEDNKKMITDAIGDSFNLEPSIQASYAGSAAGAGSGDGGLVSAFVQALRTVAPEFATNIRIDGNRDRIVDILVEENGKSVMAYGRGLLEA